MRLRDDTLWPIPIALDMSKELAKSVAVGSMLALHDPERAMLAAMHVEDVWEPDRLEEA